MHMVDQLFPKESTRKLSSIEDRGQTDHDWDQRSVGLKDRVEMDGRTDKWRRLHYLPC